MKVSYVEGLAAHDGPESCVVCSREQRRSVDRGRCRPGIELRKRLTPGRRRLRSGRKATSPTLKAQDVGESRAVRDPVHVLKHFAREPGDPVSFRKDGFSERIGKFKDTRQ